MLEREEHVVLHLRARPAGVDLGIDPQRMAEQLAGLIHEVGAEVEQEPAAVGLRRQLAPALAHVRAEALEARFETKHGAQLAPLHHPAGR